MPTLCKSQSVLIRNKRGCFKILSVPRTKYEFDYDHVYIAYLPLDPSYSKLRTTAKQTGYSRRKMFSKVQKVIGS